MQSIWTIEIIYRDIHRIPPVWVRPNRFNWPVYLLEPSLVPFRFLPLMGSILSSWSAIASVASFTKLLILSSWRRQEIPNSFYPWPNWPLNHWFHDAAGSCSSLSKDRWSFSRIFIRTEIWASISWTMTSRIFCDLSCQDLAAVRGCWLQTTYIYI